MKLKNETYDFLKYLAQIVLPAAATLCVALAKIWGFPYGTEIGGTIIALDTFLGALLQVSTDNYWREQEDDYD